MNRLSNWPTWLLCVAIFLLPWQTRYIFGFELLNGQVTEFALMSVYAVELILLLAFLSTRGWRRKLVPSLIVLAAVVVSSVFAIRPMYTIVFATHVVFALTLFSSVLSPRVEYRKTMLAFCLGLLVPIVLGGWQIVMGGSPASTILGLAARDAERLGDAVVVVDDMRVLRAYGSFPHPNIFGGFLAVGVLFALHLGALGRMRFLLAGALFFGLLLTGSRSAILGLGIAIVAQLVIRYRPEWSARVHALGMFAVICALALSVAFPGVGAATRGGGATELRSLTDRQQQYIDYPEVISSVNPLFGGGYGGYVFVLHERNPGGEWWEYQPIHSVPLLVFAEVGVFGLMAVCYAAWVLLVRHRTSISIALSIALFAIGLFDHYLWTQWAGLALVAFVFAVLSREHPQDA